MRAKANIFATVCAMLLPTLLASEAGAQDTASAVLTALAHCLDSSGSYARLASDPKMIPPGLIEGQRVSVVSLPNTNGQVYSYVTTEPHFLSCGIAIYGPVSDILERDIRQLIDGNSKWKIHSSDAYKFDAEPAAKIYWGDPLAPGLIGVVMLTRQPNAAAPTLEIEYHDTLVQ